MGLKQKAKKRYLLILVLLLFTASLFNAEKKEEKKASETKIKELNYIEGHLAQEFLPYYQKFSIKGSTKLPDKKEADVVKLVIKQSSKKIKKLLKKSNRRSKKIIRISEGKKEEPFPAIEKSSREIMELTRGSVKYMAFDEFIQALIKRSEKLMNISLKPQKPFPRIHKLSMKLFKYSKKIKKKYLQSKEIDTVQWSRKDKETEFTLIVNPLTGWKKNYILSFTFYKRPGKDDTIIKEIVLETVKELGEIFKEEKEIKRTDAENTLISIINEKERDGKIISLQGKKYEHESKTTKKISNIIKNIPVLETQLQEAKIKLSNEIKELENIDDKKLTTLFQELREAYDNLESKKKKDFFYNIEDINLLEGAVEKPKDILKSEKLLEEFEKVLNAREWKKFVKKDFSTNSRITLAQIINTLSEFLKSNEIKIEKEEEIKKAKSGIEKLLPGYLHKIGKAVSFSNIAWPETKTELDRIRIGTAYGFGGAALIGKEKDTEFDTFSFLGLKFYLGPVDKRRPMPFLTRCSRWSITLSTLFNSKISYKGQTQLDLLGGVKPMLGIGFDINSNFALNIGTIFFRQPSINPLAAESKKRFKIAFFFGLSFDFDIINRIKTLMSPGK